MDETPRRPRTLLRDLSQQRIPKALLALLFTCTDYHTVEINWKMYEKGSAAFLRCYEL